MFGLRTLAARRRLAKARAAFAAAQAAYQRADIRQDTRAMHTTANALRLANRRLIEAEHAANPLPPLPRRGVTA